MRRITPRQVQEAYEQTGLRPIQDKWACLDGGNRCACGLAAVAVATGLSFNAIRDSKHPNELVEKHLQLPSDYFQSYVEGFDGELFDEGYWQRTSSPEAFALVKAGYSAGTRARRLLHLPVAEHDDCDYLFWEDYYT